MMDGEYDWVLKSVRQRIKYHVKGGGVGIRPDAEAVVSATPLAEVMALAEYVVAPMLKAELQLADEKRRRATRRKEPAA